MKPVFLVLLLACLACGVQSTIPAPPPLQITSTSTQTEQPVDIQSQPVEMVVIASDFLNIRDIPSEHGSDIGDLKSGEVVFVTERKILADGSMWCLHELGWSNCRYLEDVK